MGRQRKPPVAQALQDVNGTPGTGTIKQMGCVPFMTERQSGTGENDHVM